jgi:hypothetical protein
MVGARADLQGAREAVERTVSAGRRTKEAASACPKEDQLMRLDGRRLPAKPSIAKARASLAKARRSVESLKSFAIRASGPKRPPLGAAKLELLLRW